MPDTVTLEHYEVLTREDGSLHELGHGAMGITYKAFDTQLRVPVALKVVNAAHLDSDSARQRFLREARAAAQLRHRNVASVFHLGEEGGNYFYVMEFIDGETLEALVKRQGPLAPELALRITAQVARALNAAQMHGLVHRDIKPSNLMALIEDDDLVVKVIDFGLAKVAIAEGATSGASLTKGGILGTPHFASPEQLEERETDTRSDIYSLGVTLWYLLCATTPFTGSVARVIGQHLSKPPPFEELQAIPAPVVDLLRKMLAKDPAERPQSPAELRAEIERCLKALGASTQAPVHRAAPARAASNSSVPLTTPPENVPLEKGVTIAQRYLITQELGESEAGTSFLARDLKQGREVQLLALHRELIADGPTFSQVEREAGLLAALMHPNVLETSGLTSTGRDSLLALGSTSGFTLRELLRTRRELPLEEACQILSPVAAGLDYAVARLPRLELGLHHVLIHLSGGPVDPKTILPRPISEWPEFAVKINPMAAWREFFASTWAASQTRIGGAGSHARKFKAGRDGALQAFGALAYELLGGVAPGLGMHDYTPLAALDESGNFALRRVLQLPESYGSAAEVVRQLVDPPVVKSEPVFPPQSPPESAPPPPKPATVIPPDTASLGGPAITMAPPDAPARRQRRRFIIRRVGFFVYGTTIALLVVAIASYMAFRRHDRSGKPAVAINTPSPSTPVSANPPDTTPALARLATPISRIPLPPTPPPAPTRGELATQARHVAEMLEARQQTHEALTAWLRLAREFPEFDAGRLGLELFISRLRREPDGMPLKDFASMHQELREAAQFGVTSAMVALGDGLRESDPQQSFAWFCAAAQGGDLIGMTQAGLMLTNGKGTTRDMGKAAAYFQEATDRGHAAAMTALAECYLLGEGTAQDTRRAIALLQKASDLGNARGQNRLGICFQKGIGVPRDERRAFELFSEASKRGYAEAIGNLGVLYLHGAGVEKSEAKAVEKFKDGSLKGEKNSMYFYAGCLFNGQGVKTDTDAAKKWFQKAAAAGQEQAMEWCNSNNIPFHRQP